MVKSEEDNRSERAAVNLVVAQPRWQTKGKTSRDYGLLIKIQRTPIETRKKK
jgi:hypothetical protein